MIELINETLTRRSSGLGGCNRKVVGGSFWFVLSVVSAVPVEAPKPLNAGVRAGFGAHAGKERRALSRTDEDAHAAHFSGSRRVLSAEVENV